MGRTVVKDDKTPQVANMSPQQRKNAGRKQVATSMQRISWGRIDDSLSEAQTTNEKVDGLHQLKSRPLQNQMSDGIAITRWMDVLLVNYGRASEEAVESLVELAYFGTVATVAPPPPEKVAETGGAMSKSLSLIKINQ
ncbi:hypothetical protein Tco_1120266 [Tanacetum coccineum]